MQVGEKNRNNGGQFQTATEYAVEIEDLTVFYETSEAVVKAVNSLNLKLKKKSVLGIVGETGAGKTSAMLSLLNLIPSPPGVIKSGKILVNGLDILSLSKKELCKVRGKEISMIFQDPMTSLNPVFPVGYQIAEGIMLHEKVSKNAALEQAAKLLETVGIDRSRANEYPHQFSGGMRQRVGVAIALACKPKVLIADEPTSALDVTIQAQVLSLMKALKEQYDTSMILITHDLGVVAEICDEVAVMYAGRIVERGNLEDIFMRAKHPYTIGLFHSLPNVKRREQRLQPIAGLVPDPTNLPNGCAFSPRCPHASDACKQVEPSLKKITEMHQVACTLYNSLKSVQN